MYYYYYYYYYLASWDKPSRHEDIRNIIIIIIIIIGEEKSSVLGQWRSITVENSMYYLSCISLCVVYLDNLQHLYTGILFSFYLFSLIYKY